MSDFGVKLLLEMSEMSEFRVLREFWVHDQPDTSCEILQLLDPTRIGD